MRAIIVLAVLTLVAAGCSKSPESSSDWGQEVNGLSLTIAAPEKTFLEYEFGLVTATITNKSDAAIFLAHYYTPSGLFDCYHVHMETGQSQVIKCYRGGSNWLGGSWLKPGESKTWQHSLPFSAFHLDDPVKGSGTHLYGDYLVGMIYQFSEDDEFLKSRGIQTYSRYHTLRETAPWTGMLRSNRIRIKVLQRPPAADVMEGRQL